MPTRNPYLLASLACLLLAVGAAFWLRQNHAPQAARNLPEPAPTAKAAEPVTKEPTKLPPPPLSKVIPLRDDVDPVLQDARTARLPRRALSDAEVLAKGGVWPAAGSPASPAVGGFPVVAPPAPSLSVVSAPVVSAPVVAAPPTPAANPLHSLQAADWKNQANQLVNALRAGKRVDLDHALIMDFLQGKDLLGWPESSRNWIGDELMILLVKDLPARAFADLRIIQENPAAPAAMRDYSVQHIGELVTKAIAGAEGADYLWQTLGQNDPATLSTTLITLHLLSAEKPGLVSASRVAEAAQSLLNHPDLRTQITAKSILRK